MEKAIRWEIGGKRDDDDMARVFLLGFLRVLPFPRWNVVYANECAALRNEGVVSEDEFVMVTGCLRLLDAIYEDTTDAILGAICDFSDVSALFLSNLIDALDSTTDACEIDILRHMLAARKSTAKVTLSSITLQDRRRYLVLVHDCEPRQVQEQLVSMIVQSSLSAPVYAISWMARIQCDAKLLHAQSNAQEDFQFLFQNAHSWCQGMNSESLVGLLDDAAQYEARICDTVYRHLLPLMNRTLLDEAIRKAIDAHQLYGSSAENISHRMQTVQALIRAGASTAQKWHGVRIATFISERIRLTPDGFTLDNAALINDFHCRELVFETGRLAEESAATWFPSRHRLFSRRFRGRVFALMLCNVRFKVRLPRDALYIVIKELAQLEWHAGFRARARRLLSKCKNVMEPIELQCWLDGCPEDLEMFEYDLDHEQRERGLVREYWDSHIAEGDTMEKTIQDHWAAYMLWRNETLRSRGM